MSNVWFISDTHLGHTRIEKFGQRTYNSIQEHDDKICDIWNDTVKKRDIVWHLGDVAMSRESLKRIGTLSGTKKLIMGNHDVYSIQEYSDVFSDIRAVVSKYGFWLTHIPIHPSEHYRKVCNIHGHVHNPKEDLGIKYLNVNWDVIGNRLISLEEIKNKLDSIK